MQNDKSGGPRFPRNKVAKNKNWIGPEALMSNVNSSSVLAKNIVSFGCNKYSFKIGEEHQVFDSASVIHYSIIISILKATSTKNIFQNKYSFPLLTLINISFLNRL